MASTHASSSKSGTSPAICTRRSLGSKRVMRRTPLTPERIARPNAALPIPFGLVTPMPVITTRFLKSPLSWCGRNRFPWSPSASGMAFAMSRVGLSDNRREPLPADSDAGNSPVTKLSLGIYISVPFCRTKCSFCNFASGVFSRGAFEQYVDEVCAEITASDAIARELGGRLERNVDSIYLGGGTPSVLEPDQLERLFRTLRDNFDVETNAEVTV